MITIKWILYWLQFETSVISLQFMKPVYEGCIEKGTQQIATHATNVALGGNRGGGDFSRQTSFSHHSNGKVKSSWGYAQSSGPDTNHGSNNNNNNNVDDQRGSRESPPATSQNTHQQHLPPSVSSPSQQQPLKKRKNRRKSVPKKWFDWFPAS